MSDPVKAQDTKISSGEVVVVENQNPKFGANDSYVAVLLIIDGKKQVGLATEHQLADMLERAQKNPEDCPKESFWNKYF